MASKDYASMTKAELLDRARRKKAPVATSMKKDDIIKALKKAEKKAAAKKVKPASAKIKKKKTTAAKPKPKAKVKKAKAAVVTKKAAPKKAKPTAEKKKTPIKTAPASAKKAAAKKTKRAAPKQARPAAPTPKTPALAAAVEEKAPSATLNATGRKEWDIEIDAKKFFTADEQEDYSSAGPVALTEDYGDNRIVALARDPHCLYVYWDVQPSHIEQAAASVGKALGELSAVVRVYDVTGIEFDGVSAHKFFDAPVDYESGSAYVNVERDGREYIVALALADDEGAFAQVLVSNRIQTPHAGMAPAAPSAEPAAETLAGMMAEHIPGSLAGEGVSSLGITGFGASEQAPEPAPAQRREFFMWVECELKVYGQTTPDARLTLQGREVELRPDGTFSVQFALPDGVQDMPVEAVSSDGESSRRIHLMVTRSTRIEK